jgi:PKD repeat protein
MKIYRKCLAIGLIILFVGAGFGAGFETLSCDANGPYEGNIMEDIEFDGTATGGSPPYEYFWDYGDGNTSSGDPHPTHNYANAGNYTVIFTVKDSVNDTASDTTWAYINAPPNAPIIDGPNSGSPNTSYDFTFNSTDPDGDDIAEYQVDWGEGSFHLIISGPFASGEEVSANNSWTSQGKYIIMARAKDVYDAESDWSEFEITIPRTRATFNFLFQWFLERFPLLEKLLGLIRYP